ncbi:hypothetical protein NST07_02575 [Paenibacillus sp. FSL L8-0340]|uniref:hypothetical protein n=1 Tax=Paenibacillus sp. FSL L8-0340 TaxID=2954685 RepID=UPI0031589919
MPGKRVGRGWTAHSQRHVGRGGWGTRSASSIALANEWPAVATLWRPAASPQAQLYSAFT